MRVVLTAFGTVKAHDQIGGASLRGDVLFNVRPAGLDLLQHRLLAIAALGDVTLELPAMFQVFLGIEPDLQVEEPSDPRNQEGMQALHDHNIARAELFFWRKRSVAVVVHRLADRPALLEREQLVLHEREVGGSRVESRDADEPSFPAIQAVVVVQAETGDSALREYAIETGGHSGLAPSAIPSDGHEDRPAGVDAWVRASFRTPTAQGVCHPIQPLNVREK